MPRPHVTPKNVLSAIQSDHWHHVLITFLFRNIACWRLQHFAIGSVMKKPATPWVIWLLSLEALLFGSASLAHAGTLSEHPERAGAATGEGLIAAVLILAVVASILRLWRPRSVALTAQGLAFFGTLLAVLTIAIGISPQTQPDHLFYAALLVILALGLTTTFKWRAHSRFRYPPLVFGRAASKR